MPLFSSRLAPDGECVALLKEFASDPEPIVSQSCEVALSMLEYERSGMSFEVRIQSDLEIVTLSR